LAVVGHTYIFHRGNERGPRGLRSRRPRA
jgi:hypothetical protein